MTTITTRAAAGPRDPETARARRAPRRGPGVWTYAALAAVLLGSFFPIYWSLIVASHDESAVSQVPPALLPGGHLLENVGEVFDTAVFGRALLNSFIVSGTVTVSVVFFSTLAGFAFAKLRFRGREALLAAAVATTVVPHQLGVIPLYILMGELGWTGRLEAVIVPGLVTAFGVFFMTQYLSSAIPDELLEAGRVDGCTTLRLYWHVVLPAARPAAAVLGLFTFMQAWNDFFWPLVVLTPEDPTVQVALSTLASGYTTDFSLVLTGTVLATVPILLVFAVLGRQIIGGIMSGAIKG
ncbi:sugar ABC transporter permease [Sphaerisporangium melleum]|uniref:Sugar ABC transporter permease n=1 Tax=Sphaerisporangium melleum TaxID=321316 RepID=A0A917R4W1_9ACTN|nr:carbohydrate ABC transporter permease [Sphaerisporangium melleum]GGK89727.1 sugar ABC transporter permease [Sphaerisporangium melleum]GII72530.1 sugar ABC transporter permease [Sphaerisporangium melleum]